MARSVRMVHMLYTVGRSKVLLIIGLMEFWKIDRAPFFPNLSQDVEVLYRLTICISKNFV